jgi:Spy/CpxP family protein refolding chaperone
LQVNGTSELANKEVREVLQITKEQQKKLLAIRHENAKARKEALANFEGDRMAKSVELQRKGDTKLLEVLTPEQRKQFEAMQGEKIDLKLFAT